MVAMSRSAAVASMELVVNSIEMTGDNFDIIERSISV